VRSHKISCHCEERSDEAISTFFLMRLPRFARNDIVKIHIAFVLVLFKYKGYIIIFFHFYVHYLRGRRNKVEKSNNLRGGFYEKNYIELGTIPFLS
jgi:hypothetical protein